MRKILCILNNYDSGYQISIVLLSENFEIIKNLDDDKCRDFFQGAWAWDFDAINAYIKARYNAEVTFISFTDGSLDK